MNLDFAAALQSLNEDSPTGSAAFDIANAARSPADYLFATILPERPANEYVITNANMVIRSTMAGLVAMDSPYPPTGSASASSFKEETAKIAAEVSLTEQALRTIQNLMLRLGAQGADTTEATVNEVLNFLNKLIIQPILDTREFLRARAIVNGAINWTFNKRTLNVNYGVPAANFLPARTVAGGDAYHLPGSKFWEDVRLLMKAVRQVRVILAHSETVDAIQFNESLGLIPVADNGSSVTFRRWARNTAGDTQVGTFSPDARDTVTIVRYDREGEIINPADPTSTIVIPFLPRGKLVAIGTVQNDGYRPGQGSVEENTDPTALGYHHIAPTVEGGGRPGMWAQVYTPENRPWALNGRGADNNLPVIERPDAIAVATTEMPA